MKAPDPNQWWGSESITIKSRGSRLEEVDTPKTRVAFEGKVIRVHINKDAKDYNDRLDFSLEEKIYEASSDNTKISFPRSRDDKKGIETEGAKIKAFLDKLMEGTEPERRFSLKRQVKTGHAMQVPA